MRTNNGVLALAVSVVLFSCVAMITLRNREPIPAELLAATKSDALAKYVKGAEMELQGLEGAMPRGSVARSFPKEERELKALFARGIQKLQNIEKQDGKDEQTSARPRHARTRHGRKGDATAEAIAIAKRSGSRRAAALTSSLVARGSRPDSDTAAARQRQLDASFAADSQENHALSGGKDVDALFRSLNSHPGRSSADKARTTQLALEEAPQRRWGVVYDPAAKAKRPLRGEAKQEFDRWSQLAQRVNDVPDPAEEGPSFANAPHKSTAWWKWNRGGDSGKWWEHNHAGRGY